MEHNFVSAYFFYCTRVNRNEIFLFSVRSKSSSRSLSLNRGKLLEPGIEIFSYFYYVSTEKLELQMMIMDTECKITLASQKREIWYFTLCTR